MTFRDREKHRYQTLKPLLFSSAAQAAGAYGNGKSYPFCLGRGTSAENLHELIREDAIRYFRDRSISWHDGCEVNERNAARSLPSNHLCCSQSACVNALAPMMRDRDLIRNTFKVFLPDLAEPLPMEADGPLPDGMKPFLAFEWIGTQNYLGEVGSRSRGANATSADFAFRFRRTDGNIQLVLGEWKYTEHYSAKLPKPEDLNKTRLRVYRQAFDRWREQRPDLPPYELFFVEPFYQLMRLTLLAQEMERAKKGGAGEMDADIVSVLHVSPEANRDFTVGFTSPFFRKYGDTVTGAWAGAAPRDRFKPVSSERLLTAIEQAASGSQKPWVDWLLKRYAWWRDLDSV